jgi:hypothetical protein
MAENINIKKENGKSYIFCRIRKKWLILTPEEKVRQFTLQKLIEYYHYPEKFISTEKTLTVHGLRKRYDIVVYNRDLQPIILVECKAPAIMLDEKTLKQIAIYNLKMQVPFLMVTNGNKEYYFAVENIEARQISELPSYKP